MKNSFLGPKKANKAENRDFQFRFDDELNSESSKNNYLERKFFHSTQSHKMGSYLPEMGKCQCEAPGLVFLSIFSRHYVREMAYYHRKSTHTWNDLRLCFFLIMKRKQKQAENNERWLNSRQLSLKFSVNLRMGALLFYPFLIVVC